MDSHVNQKITPWRGTAGSEVLIITDFPTREEEEKGKLLDNDAGATLATCLPIPLDSCVVASLSQQRPDDNDFRYLEGSEALATGLQKIKAYIEAYKSKIKLIILLGDQPLRYITQKYGIYAWRGSPLLYNGIPTLPTHNPRDVAFNNSLFPIFDTDIAKAFLYKQGKQRVYNDRFTVTADPIEQHNLTQEIIAHCESGKYITIDIETRRDNLGILCVGFGLSRERAICFVCKTESTLQLLRTLLPKLTRTVYHNSSFDITVKRLFHGIESPDATFDTMVAQYITQPELPKGLDFLCSIYTWRPCYWSDITFDEDSKSHSEKIANRESLYIYNCLDCVVTYEALEHFLEKGMHENPYFQYKMKSLRVSYRMTKFGFYVDAERKKFLQDYLKKSWELDYLTFMHMAGKVINIQSHKKVQDYLYVELGLPERKNRKGGVTADQDALVSLIGYIKGQIAEKKTEEAKNAWRKKLGLVRLILNLRGNEKLVSSYFNIGISPDGRVRSVWKVCGTETSRWSCAKYYDDTGFNAQTMPREELEIEVPDDNQSEEVSGVAASS